ncbi:hypothetical protein CYMTET_4305 [Cymbomonas tetramitiformis]|uniref:Uncharacterized protein n=1 Tax=Cymbomonas tetramitiformis TaxID=36881 RepID=A0AAE0LK82_9CHLO|nr:hypothetical protein CYMTET_4305 [Cymbomonas tetramitiformis]
MEAMQGMAQEDVLARNAFDYVASTSSSHPRPPTQAQFAEQMQHLHHQQQQLDNWLQQQELQQQREMDHWQVYQQQLDQRVAHHQSTVTATLQQIFDLVTSATKGSKEPAPPTAKSTDITHVLGIEHPVMQAIANVLRVMMGKSREERAHRRVLFSLVAPHYPLVVMQRDFDCTQYEFWQARLHAKNMGAGMPIKLIHFKRPGSAQAAGIAGRQRNVPVLGASDLAFLHGRR